MPSHDVMPGIDALGCGFNPFDSTITSHKPRLFEFDFTGDDRPYDANARHAGTFKALDGKLYSIPAGVLISPIPAEGESVAEVFESRRQVEDKLAANASIGGGYGLFRASFSASYQVDQSRTSEYSYASKRFDASFWTLSLASDIRLDTWLASQVKSAAARLPDSFTAGEAREHWDTFFDRFGTHYIAGCKVGGRCALTVAVQKTAKLTEQKISTQVDAEYGLLIKGGGSAASGRLDNSYVENRRHWETTRGGDPTLAGRLQESAEVFGGWLESVKSAPGFTDFVLKGIWELLAEEKRVAVKAAFLDYCYRNSSYALQLSGPHSYVDVTTQHGLNNLTQATFEAWIHPVANGSGKAPYGGIIINKEGSFEIARFQDASVQWAFQNIRPGWAWQRTPIIVPLKEWTHVAIVYDAMAKTLTAYKDGNPQPPVHVEGGIAATSNKLYIGARSGTEQNFDGYIEEVRIWNRALSTDEIQSQMYRRLFGSERGLVGLWTLNEATGDQIRDRSTSGNDGILRNATWAEPPSASPITLRAHSQMQTTPAILLALQRAEEGAGA